MQKGFEERRNGLISRPRDPHGPYTFSDYVALSTGEFSVDRLAAIPAEAWSPQQFAEEARQLQVEASLETEIVDSVEGLRDLSPDTRFKYTTDYGDVLARLRRGEHVLVAYVVEAVRVIGFGIARKNGFGSTIEIIDVDEYSRRDAGLAREIVIQGSVFGVGVAHVLVAALQGVLPTPVRVNAAHEHSSYVFQSLGFVRRNSTGNPCLLKFGESINRERRRKAASQRGRWPPEPAR